MMSSATNQILAAMRDFLDQSSEPLVGKFLNAMEWDMEKRPCVPETLPCLDHLPCAAAIADGSGTQLAALLAEQGNRLRWGQTYGAADFGELFLRNYGWTELFGTRGHFENELYAGGFLLLGPRITYPDHHHVAEEIYIPLTGGAEWRMGDGDFVPRSAGEIIHHRSGVSHAVRTGVEPLLALYLWRGGPLAERSSIGRRG